MTSEMDEGMDRALFLAVAFGIAAGTAAAVSSIAFPYTFDAVYTALHAKRKKELREHRHKSKSEKSKQMFSKPGELSTYRNIIRKSLLKWRDIDVSFDKFPYFLLDSTKSALVDSMHIFLKRPEFTKYMSNLHSVSPRILLTGPPGSETYQECLVMAVAHHLQANMLTLDITNILLEVKELQIGTAEVVEHDSPAKCSDSVCIKSERHLSSQECIPLLNGTTEIHSFEKSTTGLAVACQQCKRNESEKKNMRILGVKATSSAAASRGSDSKHPFKRGDRVKYVGINNSLNGVMSGHRGSSGNRGPTIGSKGRVILVLEENPNKVGVQFDKPVYGGNNLVDLCEDGYGYFCNVSGLRLEHSHFEDADKLIFEALMDILTSEAKKEPLILFIKDIDKSIICNIEHYRRLEQLDKLGSKLVVVGSNTSDFQKDKGSSSVHSSSKNLSALLELSFLDYHMSSVDDLKCESPKVSRMLTKLFPTRIHLQKPQDENILLDWNRQLEQDAEKIKVQANRQQIRKGMIASNAFCDDLTAVEIKTHMLSNDMTEKVVGWAISDHLQKNPEPSFRNGNLVISASSLQHSLSVLLAVQRISCREKKRLQDVICDNEFERILLSEVIPPDELGISFDHIGALDNVKEALRELVMLPLQRPELFSKGQLRKPCRGLLLFGPPGTGKTMLAKAVATEAGANFINISMATIASKWFGEAEKYVKAVFTLASKIAPSVIFIDEVDSMLGRRGKESEHSAMRKLKNEFMSSWDGLRTREKERVLVLAATNRPFDLDEAVIRRFPRRLMIDLPDAANRAKILGVILTDEDLAPDFNINELAAATDGYSGSDLKSLCITAAYQRIREILDQERKQEEAKDAGAETPPVGPPYIRPLSMSDMKQAMEKVRSSVASDAMSMLELRQWNDQYGEGGSRKKPTLSYYL